jgi:hypothetical protein
VGRGSGARRFERATEKAARRAARWAQPWADGVARAGYVAKGLVSLLVGLLALAAAAGLGGRATDPSGALVTAARTTAGRAALVFVTLGLFAHAAFRAALILVGEPYGNRGALGRVFRRISNAFAALIYAGLAVTAGGLAFGRGAHAQTDKDAQTRHLSARLLTAPFGRLLLVGVALGIVIAAVVQLVRACGPSHVHERLRVEEMSARERNLVSAVGRVAFAARAAVLAVCGYFVARAAIDSAPREARGPAGALRAVWALPHGSLWLAVLAGGLIAFGVYGLLEARWHRLFGR